MDGLCVGGGGSHGPGLIGPAIPGPKPSPPVLRSPTMALNSTKTTPLSLLSAKFSSFKYLFSKNDAVLIGEREREREGQNGNWVLKMLHGRKGDKGQNGHLKDDVICECEFDGGENNVGEFDRDSFIKMLKKVSLNQAKLYAQLSFLGELAYDIPNIKPGYLLKRHGLRYVTSSIEKREQLAEAEKKEQLAEDESKIQEGSQVEAAAEGEDPRKTDDQNKDVRKSAAYQIVVSAASYLHSRTRAIFPSSSSKDDSHDTSNRSINSEMASLMATTDSVTAVVAAKEEVKQAVADDLNSIRSSPCEWFICDDDKSSTRFFVIQGSETLASWQANLLFEPMQFEETDVFVHRGIYEAAKGMYQQILPEVLAYTKTHGPRAKFRFTGHSLGGSLSLLINLMLLMRAEVPYASLLPVVTFGSPCVMCGGDDLLRKLGLRKSHVQAIVMHRDIVPRAFSCNYPRPAAQILKILNRSFRNHPCLNTQKQLYSPMGEMLILQPDEKISPQHDFLPSGSGLYLVTCELGDNSETEKQIQAAKNAFLNKPHPLEILTDRSSYGSGGAIRRDHDMNSYLKCVRTVIRQELSRVRKAERERRRRGWWPLIVSRVTETGMVIGTTLAPTTGGLGQFNFGGVLITGRESLKRFSRLVASQHMHLLVLMLFPARLLLIGAYRLIV